jgi:iron complex outermembrane receptor protein
MGRASDYGSFVDGSIDGLETFKAKTIFDTELGYRFDGINVSAGVRNLFNTYPDQVQVEANTNNGTFIYPGASPFGYNGRFVYLRTEIALSR